MRSVSYAALKAPLHFGYFGRVAEEDGPNLSQTDRVSA